MVAENISHYRVIKKIGRGGMGEVYLAEDKRLGRLLALKLLLGEYTRDTTRLRRFEQEARAASALNHPNILTIYEIGESDGRHFIATEFIDGCTLREHLVRGRMTAAEAVSAAVEIASALVAAHDADIVHRDIKPENIMLRKDGYVKVLDFGLAKLMEKPHASRNSDGEADTVEMLHTGPGWVMGTAGYMSPEQAQGLPVDERTDIWSLGVVLYEMVAGRQPFDGATSSHVIVAILEQEPAPLAQHAGSVPQELQRIVGKALAKKRDERYQNAREMLADLRRLKQRMDVDAELGRAGDAEVDESEQRTARLPAHRTALDASPRSTGDARPSPTAPEDATLFKQLDGRRRSRALLFASVAAVLLVAGALLAYVQFSRTPRNFNAIAVLPFVNAGGDPGAEWLSDGLTESLINSLSPALNMKVMSRNAVFRYKGAPLEPSRVGRELGVGAVLTGQVMQRGDQLQVSVELIDARDNTHLWGDKYNRKLSDLVAVQEEIAREIAARLRARLQDSAGSKRHTADYDAYQSYLRGRYFWNKRSEEGFRKAIAYFNEAIERDPNYALAYAGLADSYALLSDYSIVPPHEAMPKARAAAERALELDQTLAEAHTSVAFVRMAYDWKWAEAEADFRRAIELNPNYATAHQWYASDLVQMGRFDEALAEIRRAQALDPLSLIINANSGLYLYYAHQYDRAVAEIKKTLEVDETFGVAHLYLGYVYLQQPARRGDAIAEFQQAVKYMGDDPETLSALGYAYAVAGRRADAQRILAQLNERATRGYVSPYFVAIIYTGLGDKERAFESLEKSYTDRHPGMILLKSDPRFDALRADARFDTLIRRIEQPA